MLNIQLKYLEIFALLKKGEYHDAWIKLERCEIMLGSLKQHYTPDSNDKYFINFIYEQVKKLQSIYPYKLFMSPEIIALKKKCSICNKKVSIRNSCGHIKGKIYNGEECYHTVTKAEILSISIVENPGGKYRVLFAADPKTRRTIDHYDYSLLKYLIKRLKSPFDDWNYKALKKRHPHSKFKEYSRNDKCPCGSNKKYKYCCLKEDGIIMPHYEFEFSSPLPDELLKVEYNY